MSTTVEEKLPALPSDITPQWLGAKLGAKVRSAEHTHSIWGTGSKLFYAITYDDDVAKDGKPAYICIKGVFDPKMVETQPWTLTLAQREAGFFSTLAPNVRATAMIFPKGWWGGATDTQGIAIMNDLAKEGCTFAPEVASYPADLVKNSVEQLAGLHASYWGQSQEDHPCEIPVN